MKRVLVFFMLSFVIIQACKNNNEKKSGLNTAALSDSADYYAQYTGTIGNLPVTMNMVRFNGVYLLNYIPAEPGRVEELRYQKDSLLENDSLFFIGSGELNKGIYSLQNEARFHLLINPGAISGRWLSGDKKRSLPVTLKRSNNYVNFSLLTFIDSVRSDGFKKDTPAAHVSLAILQPADKPLGGDWFNHIIKKDVLEELATDSATSLQSSLVHFGKNFLQDFKDDIDTLKASNLGGGTVPYSLMRYDQRIYTNLVHNNNGFAVMSASKYIYTGGAHGMFVQLFLCFDMMQKKVVSLEDVVTIDAAQLESVLEKHLREQYNISKDKPLTEILFDNRLPLTRNFYFTATGIGFLYQPYEVAAYAVGPINIWVPYTELKPYLNPAFIQRMGL